VNDTTPLRTRRLAAEEVLASLTDGYAINANVNYGMPYCSDDVRAEMTVKDYCDDMEVSDFRRFLNDWFDLSLTSEDVRAVAAPARRRTLREVCEFIAGRAEVPALEPVTILGRQCLSEGTFLTMRTMLARAGADVSQLAPSSPLGPYLRDHFMTFARDISKLSPGTFPRIEERERPKISLRCCGTAAIGLTGLAALVMFVDRQVLNCCSIVVMAIFATFAFAAWIDQRHTSQTFPELPGVDDFRDLVDTILRRPLRRRIAPNPGTAP
jgi:hypothetical protein